MLQPDVVTRLRLMAENTRVPELSLQSRVQQVDALRPGEVVHARVDRDLSNGRFHVIVRERSFEMTLPPGTRTGDTLRMTYLADSPRPTFFLTTAQGGEEGDRLSQTGRLISALVRRTPGETGQPLRQSAPLLPDGPADAAQSAPRLREALSQSGLFYESHQAQWVAGHRSLEQLRREPQGRVAMDVAPQPADDVAAARTPTSVDDAPQRAELRGGPVHPDTFPIVRQQLDALEARHAPWQGEIWAGQWLEWQSGASEDERGADGQPAWYTALAIDMPSLGAVRVRALLAADGVRVTLACADEASAQRLRNASDELASGLRARDLALAALSVTHADSIPAVETERGDG